MENLWFGGGAVGAGSESKPKQKQTHPKQNRFKPGRWVGLDPFAPGHNKTIKNDHSHGRIRSRKEYMFGLARND